MTGRKIRCENTVKGKRCGKIAIGSYYCEPHLLPDHDRFIWNGKWCAEGYGYGYFLCGTCKTALKICDECSKEECECEK